MTTITLTSKWYQRPLLFRFFTMLCCFCTTMFSSNQAFSQLQPANCKNVQCTSNDVQVISAYLSGPNNTAIICTDANPFANAQLHLIVSSNTQRIGVSISGFLKADATSYPIGNCFKDITLNNGGDNNLVLELGNTLVGATCDIGFSLTNLFVSWGTGNTNFCDGVDPQCPKTPAKCRFVPGEIIPVDVKLEVDFGFTPGVCPGGNSLAVAFTPSVTIAQSVTYPLSFDWDFGDGSPHGTSSAISLADVANAGISHTYATAQAYTVILTVTDNTPAPNAVVRSTKHTFTLVSCCNLAAPTVSAGPFCSSDNKTIADLPTSDGSGGTYSWYATADADVDDMPLPGTTVLVNGTTYYVSVSSGNCVSPRSPVTIVVNAPTTPTFDEITPICDGGSITLPASSKEGIAGTWSPAVNNTQTTEYTFTPTSGLCATTAKLTVVVNAKTTPTFDDIAAVCNGGTINLPASSKEGIPGTWSPAIDNTQTTEYTFTPADGQCATTAKLTVAVTQKTVTTFDAIPAICNGGSINLPASSKEGIPGTWSPAVDNTQTTEYTFTPAVGQCATTAKLTVVVIQKTVTTFNPIAAICYGGSFTLPTSSKEGVPGTWSPAVDNTKTTEYTFTPATGQCATTAKLTVVVNALPVCDISGPGSLTVGQSGTYKTIYTGTADEGLYTYAWTIKSGATILSTGTGASITYAFINSAISYTVSVLVTNKTTKCYKACNTSVTASAIGPSITYTQGFYGNSGGKTCTNKYSYDIMKAAVPLNGSVLFGNTNPTTTNSKSFKLNYSDVSLGTKSVIYKMLPGGTTPSVIKNVYSASCQNLSAAYGLTCTYPAVPMSSTGSINNILLAQTMALYFNTKYSSNLGPLVLTGNVLTFAKLTTTCGSTYGTGGTPQTIPCSVYKYLVANGGASINNLLALANQVLGGSVTTITPSDMTAAIDIINKGFDAGGKIVAVSTTSTCVVAPSIATRPSYVQSAEPVKVTTLTVSTYPNPFTDRIKFKVVSPVSGKASIDIYNLAGQKLYSVYKGHVFAGSEQTIDVTLPSAGKGALIYTLRVGDSVVNGRLEKLK